jgi:hypothetical protein
MGWLGGHRACVIRETGLREGVVRVGWAGGRLGVAKPDV